jgi:hypothetical protein
LELPFKTTSLVEILQSFSALAQMTPPLLVVTEIFKQRQTCLIPQLEKKYRADKCIFYSHKNHNGKVGFNTDQLKPP